MGLEIEIDLGKDFSYRERLKEDMRQELIEQDSEWDEQIENQYYDWLRQQIIKSNKVSLFICFQWSKSFNKLSISFEGNWDDEKGKDYYHEFVDFVQERIEKFKSI